MRGIGIVIGAVVLGGCGGAGGAPELVRERDGVVYREGVYDGAGHRPAAGACGGALEEVALGLSDVEASVGPRREGVGPLLWIALRPEVVSSCPGGASCAGAAFSRVSVLDRPNLAGTRPQEEAVWWTEIRGSCDGRRHRGRATVLYRGTYHSMGNVRYFGPLRLRVEMGGGRGKVLEVDYGTTRPADPPQVPVIDRAEAKDSG
jgi:hypothetical protein